MVTAILVTVNTVDLVKRLSTTGGIFTDWMGEPVYFIISDDPDCPQFFMPVDDFHREYLVKNCYQAMEVEKR